MGGRRGATKVCDEGGVVVMEPGIGKSNLAEL
jgi:hypothetical protein